MPIRVTSNEARKNPGRTKIDKPVEDNFIPKSEFHYLLRHHVISLVEDCFVQYKGAKKISEVEEEWGKFKRILERKL